MRFGTISDLITHAGRQGELASVLELGVQLPLDAQKNVSFLTPMVS